MIAYFDTSALIPLLIDEPMSRSAGALWDTADRVVSVSLVYAEGRAALAMAERMGRLARAQHTAAVAALEQIYSQLDRVAVADAVVRRAGELAATRSLRGYDAVHLSAALLAADAEFLFVTGDEALRAAASAEGLACARLQRSRA